MIKRNFARVLMVCWLNTFILEYIASKVCDINMDLLMVLSAAIAIIYCILSFVGKED